MMRDNGHSNALYVHVQWDKFNKISKAEVEEVLNAPLHSDRPAFECH